MPLSGEYSYQGFLSYSHADRKWGEWLHRRLERYQVDETLVGRASAFGGQIPARLKPIFRDREGLHAGPSLSFQIRNALEASAALIVICSPSAVLSHHVAEEIRYFKQLGRSNRVFAFIVDGEPNDARRECFPTTLKLGVATDGQLNGQTSDPIAADARKQGDGRELALSKLISGLLGVSLEVIWKRDQKQLQRRFQLMAAAAASVSLLALGAAGFGTWAFIEKARNERLMLALLDNSKNLVGTTANITSEFGLPIKATEKYLLTAQTTYGAVTAHGGESPELHLRRAQLKMELSNVNSTLGDKVIQLREAEEALTVLRSLAQTLRDDPDSLPERALRLWRHLSGNEPGQNGAVENWLLSWRKSGVAASLLLPLELKRAYFVRGQAYRSNSRRNEAMQDFETGLAVDEPGIEQRPQRADDQIINAKLLLGKSNVYYSQGRYADALLSTKGAIQILEGLRRDVQTEAGKMELADAYITAGDVARVITVQLFRRSAHYEHFSDAVNYVKRGIEEAKALYDAQPGNVVLAQLLARGHMCHGDIRKVQKEYSLAYDAYDTSRELRDLLHRRDPRNVSVKYDLGWSLMKLGETKREWPGQHDVDGAVKFYQQAAQIFDDLWNRGYVPARKSAYWANQGMEMPLRERRDMQKLLAAMERKRDLATQGSVREPQDLSLAHNDLGELHLEQGRHREARDAFEASLAITRLPVTETRAPGKLDEHRATALLGLGILGLRRDELGPAREALLEAGLVADKVLGARASDIDIMKLRAEIDWQLSEVHTKSGDVSEALKVCQQALVRIQLATQTKFAPNDWRDRMKMIAEGCEALIRAHGQ